MYRLLVVSALVFLAACSPGPEPQPVSEEDGIESAAAENPSAGPEPFVEPVAIPGSVELTTAAHLRSDKTAKTKKGATRRRLVYELLAIGPELAYESVLADFERAGFRQTKRNDRKDGSYTVTMKKPGEKTISVRFYPSLSKTPSHPEAKSMMAMSWQTQSAPKAGNPAAN